MIWSTVLISPCWDIACDRLKLVIMGLFLPFYLPKPERSAFWKSEKNRQKISSCYTSVPKIMIICYTVPEIYRVTDASVIFHFGLFFALLHPPNSLKNQGFLKMEKTPRDIIILHNCVKNHDHMLYVHMLYDHMLYILEIWFVKDWRADGRTYGLKNWDRVVVAPPNKPKVYKRS